MLVKMVGPRTYTTEDVVEINCHGGIITIQKVLALCLEYGARMAEPGEFISTTSSVVYVRGPTTVSYTHLELI